MFLIMSGAYIDQELKSEFGSIPPTFLPLGGYRLFQHQYKLVADGSNIYLSLPESYAMSVLDALWLKNRNVNIIRTPSDLSLGASLVAALNMIEESFNSPLSILFGDTLIGSIPIGEDVVAISDVKDSYNWAIVTNDNENWLQDCGAKLIGDARGIVSGYFKFSQPRQLIKEITMHHWNFIEGLNGYHKAVGLTAVEVDSWLDFGHVNTYYRSKAAFTTQRAFNELTINSKWVEKSSVKEYKIRAEADWFENLPNAMRSYIPQFLGSRKHEGVFSYRLEYLHHTALNELFVYGEIQSLVWRQIIDCCLDFIDDCFKHSAPESFIGTKLDKMFVEKTESRLKEYCEDNLINIHKTWVFNDSLEFSLDELASESQKYLPQSDQVFSVVHGDFCFSNILYDYRANRIKTIDPRGIAIDGKPTIYGDIRYDLAKLSHSIIGMYDWIIAGYFEVEVTDDKIKFDIAGIHQHELSQKIFLDQIEVRYGLSALNIYAMQIQLFLSMLPLHSDNPIRQQAFIGNAFRLHQLIKGLE